MYTDKEREREKKRAGNWNNPSTYPIAGAFEIVMVRRTLCLIDVWKDTDASLIDADQIITARCTVAYQSVRWRVGVSGRPSD